MSIIARNLVQFKNNALESVIDTDAKVRIEAFKKHPDYLKITPYIVEGKRRSARTYVQHTHTDDISQRISSINLTT